MEGWVPSVAFGSEWIGSRPVEGRRKLGRETRKFRFAQFVVLIRWVCRIP